MPITIIHNGLRQIFDAPADAPDDAAAKKTDGKPRSLARFLWLERRLPPRPLCNGIGHCGRCRVRFLSEPPAPVSAELRMLSDAERASGVRLACRHSVKDGMEIEVEDARPTGHADGHADAAPIKPEPAAPVVLPMQGTTSDSARGHASQEPTSASGMPARAATRSLRLAVDLGTTSVAWQAEDDAGNILAAGQTLNPQMCAGSDIMARLAEGVAPQGAEMLRVVVAEFLRDIMERLKDDGWSVAEICLAANPAMSALALGLDAAGLRAAPYRLPTELDAPEGREFSAPGLPPIWLPPHLAPFVGGDASAGFATLLDASRPFLLADMGTNGEFILAPGRRGMEDRDNEREGVIVASVPLGPALEGVGMQCGGMAGPGAVTAFHIGPSGLEPTTFDGGHPRHICGTGYLSLLRCLRSIGLIDAHGRFVAAPPSRPGPLESLRRKLAASLRPLSGSGENGLPLPGDLFLGAGDVENLLQVKAAFSLAVERLLAEAGLTAAALDRIYLAGALGKHAPLDALEDLGFLPPGTAGKTRAEGNTSLRGAALLLRDKNMRPRLTRALSPRRVLELASDPRFHQDFIRHMRFTSAEPPL